MGHLPYGGCPNGRYLCFWGGLYHILGQKRMPRMCVFVRYGKSDGKRGERGIFHAKIFRLGSR